MTRRFAFAISIATTGAFLLTSGCSKSGKDEQPTSPKAPTDMEPAVAKGGDLEAAIIAPGPKIVTAHGSDGTTKVIEMGTTILAETDTYVVNAVVPTDIAAGGDGFVTIGLKPKPGWKINQEFPTKLKVTAPEGVTLAAESQGAGEAASFTEKAAQFKVGFQAGSAGDKAFAATFRFAMCTDATCDPKSADLAWNLAVK